MKFFNMICFAVSLLMLSAACGKFDDSALWNDVDHAYNQLDTIKLKLEEMTAQADMLSAVVNGGAITWISPAEDGGYTVRYKGQDNVENTIVIAGKENVSDAPLLGTKEENGILYWTMTTDGQTDFLKDTDGAKIPVAGRSPLFTTDSDGYWCVNGNPLLDASGNKIKAEGKPASVISAIEKDGSGNAVLTLADGSTVTVPVFEAFNISLVYSGKEIMNRLQVETSTVPATISYTIGGPAADQVIIKAMRQENLEVSLDASAGTLTITFASGFESGSFALMAVDADGNVIIRPVYVEDKSAVPEYYGIKTADDLAMFAAAVNAGASLTRFMNEEGSVVLLSDVDMTGTDSYIAAGTAEHPFEGVFDGQGFAIKNIGLTTDVTSQPYVGIFGALKNATVKNLTVGSEGDEWAVTGKAATGTAIAGVAANSLENSTVENCTNNVSFVFGAEEGEKIVVCVAGIVADASGLTVRKCTNNADIHVDKLANTQNGGNGFQIGGIVGYGRSSVTITDSENNGDLSAPTGRGGGIVATLAGGSMTGCTNNGTIEDDRAGQFGGAATEYGKKRMGGLVGGTSGTGTIENCTNNGTVISYIGCRTGGFAGHNNAGFIIKGCTNNGNIFSLNAHDDHGAGWACGFTGGSSDITGCTGNGHVGDISMKDSPETAPYSSHYNAVKYQNLKKYDPEDNMVDWTKDFYYEMTETAVIQLAQGLKYTSYDWTNVPRKMHVLEVDLSSPEIEVTTAIADDIVPNPNANRNSNNGFVIRETLSQLCARKLAEGENVLAGFNTGFFDSNDGFPRGLHIEEGEPVFVNNQGVRSSLTNHRWAFTVFADGTASCSQKEFKGTFEAGGKEYEYYSVNDTIVRNGHKTYMANIYTSRYREVPHADHLEIKNPLSRTALYVVAEYTGSPVKVNEGYAEATVTAVYDGRTAALEKAPYLTGEDEVAIQLTGSVADEVAAAVKTGDVIKIKADVSVGGQYKSIYTQNSTMYQFLLNGKDNIGSISATNTNNTKYDPMTFVGVDQSGSKLWFFEVDGRQIDLSAGVWTSMGVKAYETYRIAEMFGAYNMTRFDGGGSSAMWVNTDGGKLVSTPSDSNGERSCMNYIYIRKK